MPHSSSGAIHFQNATACHFKIFTSKSGVSSDAIFYTDSLIDYNEIKCLRLLSKYSKTNTYSFY